MEPVPFPEEDLPQFPVAAAEALATALEQLATHLEDAIEARTRAGGNLPEFEGAVADQYRTDLDSHASDVAGVAELFRTTASRIRGAAEDHWEDRQRMVTGDAA